MNRELQNFSVIEFSFNIFHKVEKVVALAAQDKSFGLTTAKNSLVGFDHFEPRNAKPISCISGCVKFL